MEFTSKTLIPVGTFKIKTVGKVVGRINRVTIVLAGHEALRRYDVTYSYAGTVSIVYRGSYDLYAGDVVADFEKTTGLPWSTIGG